MSTPVSYSPDVEIIDPDEDRIADELVETLLSISRKTHADMGHGLRSVHAKSHGLLTGHIEILPNEPDLAQGLFAKAADYPVIMRFSSTPGDVLPDSVSTPRGLAVKVLGLAGGATQDFVMVNGPTFQAPNGKTFLSSLKLLAATTDRAGGAKVTASAVLRATETVLEAAGGGSATVRALGGEPANHPLGEPISLSCPCVLANSSLGFRSCRCRRN